MNLKTLNITYAALLHNISKQGLLDHSSGFIDYILELSDHIACGKQSLGNAPEIMTNPIQPLASVFNIMNGGSKLSYYYRMKPLSEEINYPESDPDYKITTSDYEKIIIDLKKELEVIPIQEEAVNTLLNVLETYLTFLPSRTQNKDYVDISLFDQSKMMAAIAACISEYLQFHHRLDYQQELKKMPNDFYNEKAFLMFSGDFSGIQSFIFNIISDGALKSLRSRSFFLEFLMEHIVDEVLEAGGVSRTNLIYSGGGHCYILLPNTKQVINNIEMLKRSLNRWLRESFGTKLYFACGVVDCSANDLMNIPAKDAPYEQIFRRLSRVLSQEKMHRYNAKELMELNTPTDVDGTRECRICGTEDHLDRNDNICHWCSSFEALSNQLLHKELVILTSEASLTDQKSITLPSLTGDVNCYFTNAQDVNILIHRIAVKRIYTKNRSYPNLPNSIKLYMGDYVYDTRLDHLLDKDGIQRISVLRADVDNLGQAFISGFTRESDDPIVRNRYNTLSRTAAFSRQMSLFFKYHLNFILTGKEGNYSLPIDTNNTGVKKVVTVYAGGDDIFLIGNIRDILETTVMIQEAFKRYTCDQLSISFGIGIYSLKYPIYLSATETEELESLAKENDGKNSVSLFTIHENHTYKLDAYKKNVLEQKLYLLHDFFGKDPQYQERGSSFLYRLMELLKKCEDRINIARYAYLLARLEPSNRNLEYKKLYQNFAKQMYEWILNPKDRKELLTAIYIYTYLTRKGVSKDDE